MKTRKQWLSEVTAQPRLKSLLRIDSELRIDPELKVTIHETAETGEFQWVICAECEPGNWLEAFPTFQEAYNFCKHMGWGNVSAPPAKGYRSDAI